MRNNAWIALAIVGIIIIFALRSSSIGGGAVDVQEDGATVVSNAVVLDFQTPLAVTDNGGDADISLTVNDCDGADSALTFSVGPNTFGCNTSAGGDITAVGDCTTGECFTLAGSGSELTFDPSNTTTYEEGRIYYDSDVNAFTAFNNEPDVALNIGEETWTFVRNNTGSTISNGEAVYISGAIGNIPTVALAQADDTTTSNVIAVATHSIENNTTGYVTTFGAIRDLNTSAFSEGDVLFLSATTPGALTITRPTSPDFDVFVGTVTVAHPTLGILYVDIRGRNSRINCVGQREALTFNTTTDVTGCQSIPVVERIEHAGSTRWTIPGYSCVAQTVIGGWDFRTNDLLYIPIVPAQTTSFTAIGLQVATAGAGGDIFRLGIYEGQLDADGWTPGDLVVDAGTVSVSTTGAKSLSITETLTKGQLYFLAAVSNSASGTMEISICDPASQFGLPVEGFSAALTDSRLRLTIPRDNDAGAGALADPATTPDSTDNTNVITIVKLQDN